MPSRTVPYRTPALDVVAALRDIDLLTSHFGYGKTFPYVLMAVPPPGQPAVSQDTFNTVTDIVNNLASAPGVMRTSPDDFASIASLKVSDVCVGCPSVVVAG
jgi:hypothetical protein